MLGWGVAETELNWMPGQGIFKDYRWSVGHTLFNELSASRSMPFIHKDTAKRNYVLGLIYGSLEKLDNVLIGFLNISPTGYIQVIKL